MVGNFEFALNMGVLVLEFLCFLDNPLGFYLILLFVHFLVDAVLFEGEELDVGSDEA